MRKLLVIAYACVVSKSVYDENHELEKRKNSDQRVSTEPIGRKTVEMDLDLTAPISPKERKRRKNLIAEKNADMERKQVLNAGKMKTSTESAVGPSRDQSPRNERSPTAIYSMIEEAPCTS